MSSILLVARRDYMAYVGAWGFWLGLITAPLIIALLVLGPLFLAHAEPPRTLAVLADNASDAEIVRQTFVDMARREARADIAAYLDTTAESVSAEALAAFDAAPSRTAAIAAARAIVVQRAPSALATFPQPSPRYLVVAPPAPNIEALRPYLAGAQTLPTGGALFGALNIRREEGAPVIEYWSINLNHEEPSEIAKGAMRLAMQREALASQGLAPTEADRIDAFSPRVAQFDPRPSAGAGQVTLRQRAPFYAAVALVFILWTVVFSVATMLLNGVIEEKSNKILDNILTSVSPLQMLIGKLLGVAFVSLTLFLFWGALGGALLTAINERASDSPIGHVAGAFASAFLDPRLLVAFLLGFVAGYLIYGAIFLALGALCESIQEAQTLLGPVTLVLAIPIMIVTPALDNPNAPIVEAASWFPLFTPFLLLIRAPTGLSWLEIAGMGAMMFATVFVILWLAARVFKAGVVDQVSLSSWMGRKEKG
jgi:ABC-2 type transport system permease protein